MAFLWNSWNVLTRVRRRKGKTEGHFLYRVLYIGSRAVLITTGANLLNTK